MRQKRFPKTIVLFVFILGLFTTSSNAQPIKFEKISLFENYHEDSLVIHEGLPKEFYILKTHDRPSVVVLLQHSTEIARLSPEKSKEFLAILPHFIGKEEDAASPSQKNLIEKFQDFDYLLTLGKWKEGMDLYTDFNLVKYGKSSTYGYASFGSFVRKNFGYVNAGIGVEKRKFAGTLVDSLSSRVQYNYGSTGWRFELSGPFVRYQAIIAPWVVMNYSFLEEKLREVYKGEAESDLLTENFPNEQIDGFSSNISHFAHAKFGYLNVSIYRDGAHYKEDIWKFYLDDLPLGFGTWGAGWYQISAYSVPGFWMKIHPITVPLKFGDYANELKIYPANFGGYIRRLHQLYFKYEINIHFNPFRR